MSEYLTVKKIVEVCDGKLLCGNLNAVCKSFTKDTRELKPGDVYIGIKGVKFDGNKFYEDAFNKGAEACVLERESYDGKYKGDKTIVLVDDAIKALKCLGEYKRETTSAKIVGVTGSVGKTSTRDMIYSVVSQEFKSLKTEGNFNNNIGLPLTMMRLFDEEVGVIEMGMNHLGEIDYLSKIAKPHIGVITNIGTAHIGELGSRENILKAKLEILNGLERDGKLIINNDNDMLHKFYLEKSDDRLVSIGIENKSDFMATDIEIKDNKVLFNIDYNGEKCPIECPVPNKVFVYNALIAFAVGTLLKIDVKMIQKGIENFKLTKNRLEIFKTKRGLTVINDAYNASIDSMESGLDTLKSISNGRKIAVLGSMLELGDFSEELHRKVGKMVVTHDVDILLTAGMDAKFIADEALKCGMRPENIYICDSNEQVIEYLKTIVKEKDTLLIKASNGLHFYEIVAALRD